ncbi:MAG: hypothetical protein IJA32_06665 [Lachnospiraceae bacterium]|nr:hypothetical protein [Lachnospiraceae bacterium]
MEITKREVIASVSIVAIMLLLGILISGKISEKQMDENEIYNKAVKIEEAELFQYGMETNVGYAFVYGDLKPVDTVTYPELGGAYMYVKKVEEQYTMHTRQVAHTKTVNGKTETYYTTETYWSWDTVGSESIRCKEVSFCGIAFNSNRFNLPNPTYIDTINESAYIRYKYYGTGTEYKGTIFTELRNNTISDNTSFYINKDIKETIEYLETDWSIAFWFLWIILTGISVCGFYYLDNKWLE